MFGDVGQAHERRSPDRQFGNWRIVVSAWLLVLVVVMLVAAVDALACRRVGSHSKAHFAGAVIPQHEPCVGPGIPSAVNIDGCESAPLDTERRAY